MGGDSAKDQMRMLAEGVDIVCGTPGRLDDLISTGKLDLSGVSVSMVNPLPVDLGKIFILDSLFCAGRSSELDDHTYVLYCAELCVFMRRMDC